MFILFRAHAPTPVTLETEDENKEGDVGWLDSETNANRKRNPQLDASD